MQNLKTIQLKSGIYLFFLAMIQIVGVSLLLGVLGWFFSEDQIQDHLWTYFNIMTVILFIMSLRMGKQAIDQLVRRSEIGYVGISTILKLIIFTLSSSLVVFYGYYMLVYEDLDVYSYILGLFSVLLVAIFVGFIIMVIPSLIFGGLYGVVLKYISKPLSI